MESGISRKNQNRAIQQEALRERLEKGGHVQHVLEISDKLANLDVEMNSTDASRLKAAADIKLKIVDKYLASLKAVEMTGKDGSPLLDGITVQIVDANSTNPEEV